MYWRSGTRRIWYRCLSCHSPLFWSTGKSSILLILYCTVWSFAILSISGWFEFCFHQLFLNKMSCNDWLPIGPLSKFEQRTNYSLLINHKHNTSLLLLSAIIHPDKKCFNFSKVSLFSTIKYAINMYFFRPKSARSLNCNTFYIAGATVQNTSKRNDCNICCCRW